MEHREDGLLVDYSGVSKLASELGELSQETKLFRAMNEIRSYTPKSMTPTQRQMFDVMCEKIFAKHGITKENYLEYYGHLGQRDQLHK